MTYVQNRADTFAADAVAGFAAAHATIIRRVPGGVARAGGTAPGGVVVVVGGGAGHYPAFAGLVGEGLAHAAALGEVFASPSAQQIYTVAKAVARDGGVLFSYGNYAGDALNFDIAQERLRADGIDCRTVRVTDDICSAPSTSVTLRRGIAGDLAVFRSAAWAAEQGFSLERVAELAERSNGRTRSIGVAFSGCTLPGAAEPLFSVPAGQMAVGMGIHGEPGIELLPVAPATELADLLVERLLEERPDEVDGNPSRVAVILNGLGAVKGEELFVLYGAVDERLAREGLVIVEPEVGEFATSFEMAGVSLTLSWLDQELEAAWTSAAYSAAYRKGVLTTQVPDVEGVTTSSSTESPAHPVEATPAAPPAPPEPLTSCAVAAGRRAYDAVEAIRVVMDREVDMLGRLDAVAGDGDHGIGMQRGARAAAEAARQAAEAGWGASTVLARAGDAWALRAGGTSGALWGAGLRAVAERLGDESAPLAQNVADAVAHACAEVQRLGGAHVGDRTLVDALVPFATELSARVASGDGIGRAWRAACAVARSAADSTSALVARRGRARAHGQAAVGTPDAGAVSLALALSAVSDALRPSTTEGK